MNAAVVENLRERSPLLELLLRLVVAAAEHEDLAQPFRHS